MASVLRPDPEVTLPPWPVAPRWDADLRAARGICYAVLFALPFWLGFAVALRAVLV